jgi:hypothetical protein
MLTCLTLAVLGACTADSPTALDAVTASAAVLADRVDDLRVATTSDSTIELSWTEVDDGTDRPALYRLKYALPPLAWASATVGCNVKGSSIGAPISCTVSGLAAGTTYDFQLMSYRLVRNVWQGGVYSNVARGATDSPVALAAPVGVTDLAVTAATRTSITLAWTQVDDGTGVPAKYRVKYSEPAIDWGSATIGCDRVTGTTIGATTSCTIGGLASGTTYDVQLMSYRTDASGGWQNALRSNVTTAATAPDGIWIGAAELASRPISGADWDKLLQDAARNPGTADIGDQDSHHDVYTLAAALVCVRIGQHCAKARQGVLDAMYTEEDPSDADGDPIPMARWMSVGRNLSAYVIAADLLDLRHGGSTGTDGERVQQWLEGFMTKQLMDNNDRTATRGFEPFHASANGAAQEGFAYAAVAAYLRDQQALDFVWEAYRTFVCDPGAVDVMNINLAPAVRDGWTHDDGAPCAVNPAGTTKIVPLGVLGAGSVRRIDGALVGDMRRGGVYQWEPGYTSYPWVGLEGLVPAAVILERAGYPAFAAGDRAVLRTHEYLWYVRTNTGDARWFDGVRSRDIVHLVNAIYNQSFPINQTIGGGRTVGYTGWTHPSF